MVVMVISPALLDERSDRKVTLEVLKGYLESLLETGNDDARDPLGALNNRGDVTTSLPLLFANQEHAAHFAFNNPEATGLESDEERREWKDTVFKPLDELLGALRRNFPETREHFA